MRLEGRVTGGVAPVPVGGGPDALSSVAQDYLKVIWTAGEWSNERVTTKALAARLGVGAPTVSENVRRLVEQGLVTHPPYGAVELTAAGTALAVAMVRRHRLLEAFLVSELGYGWDEVHDEAEVLEHAVSELLIERIDERLGRPARDPHGDPIPTVTGRLEVPAAVPLHCAAAGRAAVARISDADPTLLRRFASLGLELDTELEILSECDPREPGRVVEIALDGVRIELDGKAAAAVWVVPGRLSAASSRGSSG